MGFYVDITLLPDAEVSLSFLWRKVYQQVHHGLVGLMSGVQESEIGVSFPDYQTENLGEMPLGRRLRLYSKSKEKLVLLNTEKLFCRLRDYVHVIAIRNVPNRVRGHSCFKRVQSKSNTERLARRKARRHQIDYEQALLSLAERKNVIKKAPYINLLSISSGHNFPLIIEQKIAEAETVGAYNSYGLSPTTTVPVF